MRSNLTSKRKMMMAAAGCCASVAFSLAAATGALAQERCVQMAGTDDIKETQTMDPAFLWGEDDAMHIWAVYEPLVYLDEKFEPHPRLATGWEANEDATIWTFYLREGVKFHDGSEFTAEDARYSIMRLIDPEVASPGAPALSFLNGGEIVAKDKYTLEIHTASPVVELPIMLSTKFTLMIKDGATSAQLASKENGTGAFMAPDYVRAGEVRHLVKFADYWDPDLPKAECITITTKPDPLAMAAAFASGEIDYAPNVNGSTARSLQNADNVEVLQSNVGSFLGFAMWTDTPPFDDVRVRQALKLIANREVMVNAALFGFGIPTNDHNVPPFFPTSVSDTAIQPDLEKARALLSEAGYNNDLEIDLFTAEIKPGLNQLASLFAQMASQVGVTVNVVTMPQASYWDEVWNKRPFFVTSWGLRSTADGLAVAHRSTAAWNETRWMRPDFDALLDQAAATVDQEARFDLYRQAQQLLQDEGGSLLPVMAADTAVLNKNCSGAVLANIQQPDFRFLECDH